jgi:hypothetical protein
VHVEALKKTPACRQRVRAFPFFCFVATGWDGPFGRMSGKYRGAPGWTVHELACGHDIPIDMPDELTALLIEAA